MSKLSTGATISYGAVLPAPNKTTDGALFFLTSDYEDPIGSATNQSGSPIPRSVGLHIYSFQQDTNAGTFGDQVGQGWRQLSSMTDYVDVAGDVMTGNLQVGQGAANGGTIGYTRLVVGTSTNPGYIGFYTADDVRRGYAGWKEPTNNRLLLASEAGWVWEFNASPLVNGNSIWHAGNDGAGSGLDADLLDGQQGTYYTNLANSTGNLDINTRTTGTLAVSRGGTNMTAITDGGIIFASTSTAMGSTAAGTAGQLLQSGGTGTPTWINQGSVAAGSAVTAQQLTTARTISLTGDASGSTSFDGTANVSIAVVNNNAATADTLTTARTISLTGDVTGSTSFNGSANVSITATVANDSHTHSNYLLNTTDSLTGDLTVTSSMAIGSVSIPAGDGSVNMTGNLTLLGTAAAGFVSAAGNIISNGGNVQSTTGDVLAPAGVFQGSTGSAAAPTFTFSAAGDTNTGMYRSAENVLAFSTGGSERGHFDSTGFDVTGTITASGDVVAYSSDARLKKNVSVIPNAIEKVRSLGGYEYDWDLEKTRKVNFHPTNPHEHGLLAQEVMKVVPDAVAKAPFNEDYLTVKYERLVALLVAAINEQQTQIDSLQSQLVAMSQKL